MCKYCSEVYISIQDKYINAQNFLIFGIVWIIKEANYILIILYNYIIELNFI